MQKDIETLKKMKKVVEELYNTYLKQSNCCFSNSNDNNCWHDDSWWTSRLSLQST